MTSPTKALTIVVVDDEIMILDVMKTILEAHGMRVFSFKCASEAIAYLHENHASIDAVITDYKMPGKFSGCDIFTLIKMRYPLITCFIVSGYMDMEDAEIGDQFLVTKPINFDQFLPVLYAACEERVKQYR